MTDPTTLSAREIQCLQRIANGFTRDAIAMLLSLLPSTGFAQEGADLADFLGNRCICPESGVDA